MEYRKKPVRDPDWTRAVVLDAAEALFAEKGYDAVRRSEVGVLAGGSRGTLSYFFGATKGLYRAVVDRIAADVKGFVGRTPPNAEVGVEGRSPEDAIAFGISAYVDVLASRPNFVRMMGREVLDAGRLSGGEPGLASLSEALGDPGAELLAEDLASGPFREGVDARQLIASIIALCFFPFAHAQTLLVQLGIDPRNPAFI